MKLEDPPELPYPNRFIKKIRTILVIPLCVFFFFITEIFMFDLTTNVSSTTLKPLDTPLSPPVYLDFQSISKGKP